MKWKAEYPGGSHYTNIIDEQGEIVAFVETHVCGDNGYALAGAEFAEYAALIAAAPELLAACKAVFDSCLTAKNWPKYTEDESFDILTQAIAKAEQTS